MPWKIDKLSELIEFNMMARYKIYVNKSTAKISRLLKKTTIEWSDLMYILWGNQTKRMHVIFR